MSVINTLGRRKTSVARLYMSPGTGNIVINRKPLEKYFPAGILATIVHQPFVATEQENKFDVKVNVKGGGITGQAEAIRLAISRALVELDPEHKPALKAEGFMTRDPRMVERKKYGRAKARKKFQWNKR